MKSTSTEASKAPCIKNLKPEKVKCALKANLKQHLGWGSGDGELAECIVGLPFRGILATTRLHIPKTSALLQ